MLLLVPWPAAAQSAREAGGGFTLSLGLGPARAHLERENAAPVDENFQLLTRLELGAFVTRRVAVLAGFGGGIFSVQDELPVDDFSAMFLQAGVQYWLAPRWAVELGAAHAMVTREGGFTVGGAGLLASVSFALSRRGEHVHFLSLTWLESGLERDGSVDGARQGHRIVGLLFRWQRL